MKVRLLVGLSGPAATLEPGDLYECDDAEGTRLVCARYALPVDDEIEMRPAVAAVETAAGPRKRRATGAKKE